MIPIAVYCALMLIIGMYIGTFRHYSNLDPDFKDPNKNNDWSLNETIKGDYRIEIRIVVMAIILIISLISICFTENKAASMVSFLMISPFFYSLGYSLIREILDSNRYFPGILSFSQHPLSFRFEVRGYTVIDWLALVYLFLATLGAWLYVSWNI